MRALYFEINGQTLRKIDNFSGIIKGSKQYLKCHFAVKDPEWTGMGIVAVFENNDGSYAVAVQKDGSCMVPDEVTDGSYFKVSVVGVSGKNKNITTENITKIQNEGSSERQKISQKGTEMIADLKRKLYFTDESSGKTYVGELKIINGKPSLEYKESV